MISISSFKWKLLQDSPKTFFVMFTTCTFPSLSSSLTNVAKFLMSTRSSSLEFNHVSLFLCFLNFFESYKTKYMMAYIIIVLDKISYNYYQEIVNENWKKKKLYLDGMSSKADHLGRPQNLIPKSLSNSCNLVRNRHKKWCIWLIRSIHNNQEVDTTFKYNCASYNYIFLCP